MRIKSLTVCNIGPFYGEQHVEFGTGLISIEGRYTDKPGESNRAGKTALIDLIRFGLYGVHRHKSVANYVNRKANVRHDGAFVSIELGDDETSLHIVREFDNGKQSFTTRIPEDPDTYELKQSELQKYIEDNILGCSYDNAQHTWLVLQNQARGIMEMTPAERRKFLLEMFSPKIYPWEDYYKEVVSRLTNIKTRQSVVVSRITNLNNRLMELNVTDFATAMQERKNEIEVLRRRKDELRDKLRDLESATSPEALDELRRQLTEAKRDLTLRQGALQTAYRTAEKLKRDLQTWQTKSAMLAELETSLKKLTAKYDESAGRTVEAEYGVAYDRHKEKSTQLATTLSMYKNVSKFKGVCPITMQECESGAGIEEYKAELETSINNLTEEVDGLQQRLDKLAVQMEVYEKTRRDIEVVKTNIQATKTALSLLTDSEELYQRHMEQVKEDEAETERQRHVVEELEAQLKSRTMDYDLTYNRQVHEVRKEASSIDAQIKTKEAQLNTLIADAQRKKTFEEDLDDANKEYLGMEERIKVLQALKPMLNTSGIPFYYLLASIADFEKSVNQALTSMGTDLNVSIEPYTVVNTWSSICPVCGFEFPKGSASKTCLNPLCCAPREKNKRETMEIQIKGQMFDVAFDEDSGGGQQWTAMGVRLALFKTFRERGLMENIGFWSLDEVFAPLSESAKFSMLSHLDNICRDYGIEQMFIITHTDISAAVPPSVIIERTEATQESRILS